MDFSSVTSFPSNAIVSDTSAKLAYRINEVIEATGLSRATINRAIASGRLRAIKVGWCVLIRQEDLLAYIGGSAIRPEEPIACSNRDAEPTVAEPMVPRRGASSSSADLPFAHNAPLSRPMRRFNELEKELDERSLARSARAKLLREVERAALRKPARSYQDLLWKLWHLRRAIEGGWDDADFLRVLDSVIEDLEPLPYPDAPE